MQTDIGDDASAATLPDWATLPSTSTTPEGVLRDFARDTLKHMQDTGTIARSWGADHPLLTGDGTLSAADVLNFLDDGCRDQRDRTGGFGAG